MENKDFIGCSGFSQGYWKGFFYPEDLASKDYLSFYAQHLKAVEINSTFYRKPTLKTLENWFKQSPEDFRFFIKIPRAISHLKKLTETKMDTQEFCDYISLGLKEKLAGFLFQVPPSFQYTSENLEKVLDTVTVSYLNVIEFRHRSWWNQDVFDQLKAKNIIFVGVSIPKDIPDELIINNENFLYYRLHGIPQMFKSEYSEIELKHLAEKINQFKGSSFVFFNNTFGIAGIKNALYLNKLLKVS